jgi:hypothetical protein
MGLLTLRSLALTVVLQPVGVGLIMSPFTDTSVLVLIVRRYLYYLELLKRGESPGLLKTQTPQISLKIQHA